MLMENTRRKVVGALAASLAWSTASSLRAAVREEWDLIVVGAGTAGIPAALFASERGLRVLCLEKAAQIGGTLWFSGGQMSAAGTRRQRALGIDDNAERHLADVMRISRNTADQVLVRRAVNEAGPTLDWLDSAGFEFAAGFPVAATGHEPYSRPRVWAGPERGLSILKVLKRQLEVTRFKPAIRLEFEVDELLLEKNSVCGVRGRDSGGHRHDFRARNVLLASGGYMANPVLFADVNGLPQYKAAGWPANTGIGVTLARSVGGYTRGEQNYLCDFGSIPVTDIPPCPDLARSVHHPQRRPPWEIYVNVAGRRFIREDDPSVDTRERALVLQPQHRYWMIFDDKILEKAPAFLRMAPPGDQEEWSRDDMRAAFGQMTAFVRGDSLEELAAKAGIDGDGLRQTVETYNRAVKSGSGDPWGRQHMPLPITSPPYYAIRHQGGTLISVGGVAVDEQLRVVRRSGDPVGGLYAAGELLGNGSLSGRAFCSGMSVTPALSLGRWLGLTVA